MYKVLLFGGTGFVGNNFTKLYREHYQILSFGSAHDIRDSTVVDEVIREHQPEYVINLASISTLKQCEENSEICYDISFKGNRNIINALKKSNKIKSYLYVSSSEVYDHDYYDKNHSLTESDRIIRHNAYNSGKLDSEDYCNSNISHKYMLNIARPFTHIGPYQSSRFGFSAIAKKAVYAEKNIIEAGNTERERDLTDVRDVCDAYMSILQSKCNGETFNICSNSYMNLDKYLKIINNITGNTVKFDRKESLVRKDERNYKKGSYDRISSATQWKPKRNVIKTTGDILSYWRDNKNHD